VGKHHCRLGSMGKTKRRLSDARGVCASDVHFCFFSFLFFSCFLSLSFLFVSVLVHVSWPSVPVLNKSVFDLLTLCKLILLSHTDHLVHRLGTTLTSSAAFSLCSLCPHLHLLRLHLRLYQRLTITSICTVLVTYTLLYMGTHMDILLPNRMGGMPLCHLNRVELMELETDMEIEPLSLDRRQAVPLCLCSPRLEYRFIPLGALVWVWLGWICRDGRSKGGRWERWREC
jgi:hypothetical protein